VAERIQANKNPVILSLFCEESILAGNAALPW
jgi:hypothetical protein